MTLPHPTTLIIGDIHHDTERVDQAIRRSGAAYDQIVFLGDYWDDWGDGAAQMRATCLWLKDSLARPNRIHLLGNHDLAYFFPHHHQCRCPGHTPDKQRVFDEEMPGMGPALFRVAIQVGSWLLSHAGFSATFARGLPARELVQMAEKELSRLATGQDSTLLQVGPYRGGQDKEGGPFWCDWSREFRPVPGLHQIVGHSPARGVLRARCLTAVGTHRQFELCEPSPWPRMTTLPQPGPEWTSVNWCLDTRNVFVGLLQGDQFTPLVV